MEIKSNNFDSRFKSPIRLRYIFVALTVIILGGYLVKYKAMIVGKVEILSGEVKVQFEKFYRQKPQEIAHTFNKDGDNEIGFYSIPVSDKVASKEDNNFKYVYMLRVDGDFAESETTKLQGKAYKLGFKTQVRVVDLGRKRNIKRLDIGPFYSLVKANAALNKLRALQYKMKLVKYPVDLSGVDVKINS